MGMLAPLITSDILLATPHAVSNSLFPNCFNALNIRVFLIEWLFYHFNSKDISAKEQKTA
jgi:hypothetical protein